MLKVFIVVINFAIIKYFKFIDFYLNLLNIPPPYLFHKYPANFSFLKGLIQQNSQSLG